jgi:hypothetical protein
MSSIVPEIIFNVLPGSSPTGQSMKHHPIIDELRNLLSQENDTKWREIRTICIDMLSHQSKDFDLFVRLVEALAYGEFKNLNEGLDVYYRALESFWNISISQERLDNTIRLLDEALRKQCLKYQISSQLTVGQALGYNVRNQRIPHNEDFVIYLRELPKSIQLCQKISSFIAKYTPEFTALEELTKILNWLKEFLPEPNSDASIITADTVAPVKQRAGIMHRDKAYAMIKEAEEYLAIHEPHSLVPPLLKLIYLWKEMPLGEIIADLRKMNDSAPEAVWAMIQESKRYHY